MANRLSNLLANVLAVPAVKNPISGAQASGFGVVYGMVASISVLAADGDGIIYPCFRVDASWILKNLQIHNDAITGGTDYDFGGYVSGDWNQADQTVKDKDIYCDGISMATARNTFVHNDTAGAVEASLGSAGAVLGAVVGGGTITGIQRWRRIWQDLGDTVAPTPGTTYDLALTANTVGTGAGTILVCAEFIAGA